MDCRTPRRMSGCISTVAGDNQICGTRSEVVLQSRRKPIQAAASLLIPTRRATAHVKDDPEQSSLATGCLGQLCSRASLMSRSKLCLVRDQSPRKPKYSFTARILLECVVEPRTTTMHVGARTSHVFAPSVATHPLTRGQWREQKRRLDRPLCVFVCVFDRLVFRVCRCCKANTSS